MNTINRSIRWHGIDLARVFEGLRGIGWQGYVTIHQVLLAGQQLREEAARHRAAIRAYLGGN